MPLPSTARAEEFLEIIRGRLSPRTFHHSVSVAEFMVDHVEVFHINVDGAVTAGLLHDLAKNMSSDELLASADQYDIPISPIHQAKPALLHGPIAAEECRRTLDVDDADVYDAIYWHSTGKPQWSSLGLALYFADFAEPSRTHPQAAKARTILDFEGYPGALLYVADRKLEHVLTKTSFDPTTKDFHEWLKQTIQSLG